MAALREQARGVINVCKTALAHKGKDSTPVDNQTVTTAQAILAQAKATLPDDKVLAATSLKEPVQCWTAIQTAMEIVAATNEQGTNPVEYLEKWLNSPAKCPHCGKDIGEGSPAGK